MKRKHCYILLLFYFFLQKNTNAQSLGFEMTNDEQRVDIPFDFENNFIVVNIVFQNLLPLKFIFDTGAEHTILCKKDFADLANVRYNKVFKILGADMKTELRAYLARGIHLRVEDSYVTAPKQDILVLEDDYFKLDEASGVRISGILGADMFNRYIVKIDYGRKVISLFNTNNFIAPKKGYECFDIKVKNGKPYFYPSISVLPKDSADLKILIDTGASLTFLLFANSHPSLYLPPNCILGTIGRGLGGTIDGFTGRVHHLKLSPTIRFQNLITSFQDVSTILDSASVASRNGIFGSQLLSRFTIYIDYPREKIYMKPNWRYKQKFKFDRSGLSIFATGIDLHNYIVNSVAVGSPAHWADIRKEDEIVSINRVNCAIYELYMINGIFQGRAGKKLRIVIKRNGYKYTKYIVLKDLV